MDVVVLARIQFAANITFHILFPSISIALGWVLLFFRLKHLRATDPQQKLDWLRAYRLWTKIFALTFALGVVSGVTMSFQFGTNWPGPGYMERVGNIAGPLLSYEVLTAFFLSFLGLSYSIYPFVVIDSLTVWQAASSPESLKIILIGVCVTLPVIIAYTGFSYRVFRGKTIELDYA
jgi:cytochrome bd-type quinol oxidase subunit 1